MKVHCKLTRLKKCQDGLQTLDDIRDDRRRRRGRRSSHYIADIHLDVANWDKIAFNEPSLHHRLHDISILTRAGYGCETRSPDTSSEARTLPLTVRGRIIVRASQQGPQIIE
jgi:hypothetical protein